MDIFSSVIPGVLYISSYEWAESRERLREYEIDHVVMLGSEDDFHHYYKTFEEIEYFDVIIDDELDAEMSIDMLDKICEFIESACGPVLVHCFAGRSRSAAVVIAYLMRTQKRKYRHLTLSEAYDFLLDKHPPTAPNAKFMRDLKVYEQHLVLKRNI